MKTEKITDWISVEKELPKVEREYLVTLEMEMVGEIYTYIDLAYFAQDLCAIDDHDFQDKKGISGFYKHDTEWGDNYEIYPIAWQPLPKAYEEEIK